MIHRIVQFALNQRFLVVMPCPERPIHAGRAALVPPYIASLRPFVNPSEQDYRDIYKLMVGVIMPLIPEVRLTVLIVVIGAISVSRMPVDAYPDLSPPMVEIITQW